MVALEHCADPSSEHATAGHFNPTQCSLTRYVALDGMCSIDIVFLDTLHIPQASHALLMLPHVVHTSQRFQLSITQGPAFPPGSPWLRTPGKCTA